MIDVEVGEYERRDIDAQINRILRDLGNPPPPLQLADVRKLLKLDLQYYKSTDPGLLEELTHRFKLLARKTIPDIGKHLSDALAKSKLTAFWVPASMRILLDETVPEPKHRWIEGHEISHSVTDWHKEFLLGDNSFTLDPVCHATIEAEANYGAGRLLFMSDLFATEARDLEPNFDSVKKLAKRYDNSIVSTFWRLIESRDPTNPAFGIISSHPRFPEIGAHDGTEPWRYFIRSPAFRSQFSNIEPEAAFALVKAHATSRTKGPIFNVSDVLENAIGEKWEFNIECFSTTRAVLTLGLASSKRGIIVSV
jgi:Zn-dependent peptidase ImmA (M78 family)